jgi:uncharacterized protein (DUF58 family)
VNAPGEAERLLRRLDFTVIRRLDGMRQGDHVNVRYGPGLDLAELREYQPGDDVRALDWNVTARMGQPYVRRYHEDREITAWLVLDLTASLDFGSGLQSKRDLLIDIAGTLGRLLTARGDRVGGLLYTGSRPVADGPWSLASAGAKAPGVRLRRHEWWGQQKRDERERRPADVVTAGQGRDHVLHLLQRVLATTARLPAPNPARTPRERAGTHLEVLLQQAFRTAGQRSLVIVLSDFLDDEELTAGEEDALNPLAEHWYVNETTRRAVRGRERLSWTRALAALAQRHEVVGVWVRDAREEALPDVGTVTFQDAETGEQLVVDTSQPALRAAYASLAERRRAAMERAFGQSGATLWTVNTAEPLVPALVRFLDQRRRTAVGLRRSQSLGSAAGTGLGAVALRPA